MSDAISDLKIPTIANVGDDRNTEGFLEVHLFSPREKLQQSLKKLALFWAIALVSVLIPVFHFVLVPLFFFLGIFFAYRSSKSDGQVLGGRSTCPHCQKEVAIKRAELQWPLSEICQNCTRVLRISRKSA
ncbi:hypothetical protein [Bdellovibrio sp. HCB2-146]|uniref:hypothetical protein n=1 Tax=Bdellovibrio sp. HCB2-146 TaxID=3394362 RepID=UPI0039BD1467